MSSCVIVIPVHSASPSANELLSFRQCFRILKAHPVRVLAPQNLNMEKYRAAVAHFEIIFIDPAWQSSLLQYNQLKVSPFFYALFKEYDYLLTYELDAFVFRDELEYWCKKKLDYIGAPWFEGYASPTSQRIKGVGNSGFSLRNINSCRRILKRTQSLKKTRSYWFKYYLQSAWGFENMIKRFKNYFHLRSGEALKKLMFNSDYNEDIFWAEAVPAAFIDFNIASEADAVKFSFDVNPSLLYQMNNQQLPFGCHGWEKYEPEFWKAFIQPGLS